MRTASVCLLATACAPASAFLPPAPLARFTAGSTRSTSAATARTRQLMPAAASLRMTAAGGDESEKKSGWDVFTAELARKFTVAAAVAAVALSAPGEALAARSGGRMGGRSFSAPSRSYAPSSRSYSPAPSYRGGGGVGVLPVPVPLGGGYGSPFGFSPFGFSPFGYSPFGSPGVSFYGGGFGVNPVDILLLGGAAYGISRLVKGGGPSFGNMEDAPPSSLGEGVDVLKLQVAVNCRDRSRNSILGVLSDLSERGDTESRAGLASVVSEVSLALARKQVDWIASSSQLEHFSGRNAERAEATFSQYAVQIRTRVGRETKAVIGGKSLSAGRSSGGAGMSSGGPTVAVVSLVLALRGDQLKRLGLDRSVNSVSGLRTALETLAAGALTDGGENVLAAELLWTPEEPWEVLTRQDAIDDYPELMDI